jgi:hypothetical protein
LDREIENEKDCEKCVKMMEIESESKQELDLKKHRDVK